MIDWSKYITRLHNKPHRPIIEEAISYSIHKDHALDLGAGAMNEARYLNEQGFHTVAIESNSTATEYAKGIDLHIMPIEEYSFPYSEFDLVSALYTLPFLERESIPIVMEGIARSLKPDGIFVGQFFGPEDDWAATCTSHTLEEVELLLRNYDIVKLEEQKGIGPTALSGEKHWHVFHVIARKK